jgi:Holliday junction resolvase
MAARRINSRAKGAAGERELAEVFRSMGYQARRSQQFCGSNSDSDLTVEEMAAFLVECKRVQRLDLHAAVEKAASDAKPHGKLPMVCHRKNGADWLLTIRLSDLHDFVGRMVQAIESRQEVC